MNAFQGLAPAQYKAGPDFDPAVNAKTVSEPVGLAKKFKDLTTIIQDLDDDVAAEAARADGARDAGQRARAAFDDAKGRRSRILADDGRGVDHAALAQADVDVADARRKLEHADALGQPAFKLRDQKQTLLTAVKQTIASAGEVKTIAVKPLGTDAEACARATAIVLTAKEDRDAIAKAPVTFDTALAIVTEEIGQVADGLKVSLGVNGKPRLRWPMVMVNAEPKAGIVPTVVDAAALVAAHLRDDILADAEAQLKDIYARVPLAIDDGDKRTRLKKLDADILQAERVEAATIWSARKAGVAAAFRPDISPLAVLGIEVTKTQAAVDAEMAAAFAASSGDPFAGQR